MDGTAREIGVAIAAGAAIQLALLGVWVLAGEGTRGAAFALSATPRRTRRWIAAGAIAGAIAGAWGLAALVDLALPPLARVALLATLLGAILALALRAGASATGDRRFRELFDRAPLGMVVCDRAGQVRLVNARMWQALGAPGPLPARLLGNVLTHPAAVSGGGAALARRALERGETVSAEASYASRWRGARLLRVIAGPLRERDGEIAGALLVAEDVSEQQAIQRHLREGRKLDAMSQLAALIAHELKDALSAARTNLSVLREELDAHARAAGAPGARELDGVLADSAESVERALSLVRDLEAGAPSRAEADEALATASLTPLLRGCVRIASAHSGSGLLIDEQYADVPPVRGSASLLRQAILHVLLNAVEAAGPRGKVQVRTQRADGVAVVRVSDDGPGVLAEHAEHIFEPFFSTRPAGAGAGLGLYLARAIVKAHGGELRLLPSYDAGATFELRLPLASSPGATRSAPRPE